MAKTREATGAERRGGTHQQEGPPQQGHAAVVAPTPPQGKDGPPDARRPAGQGTDPTKQDQQDGREGRADPSVDKGEADRRERR